MKRAAWFLSALLAALTLPVQAFAAEAETPAPQAQPAGIVINEVESDGDTTDWVEITNLGTEPVDISGWFLTDDKGLERKSEGKTTPMAAGAQLAPGAFLVLEKDVHFKFGLGNADAATLYNGSDEVVDTYTYESTAVGTWSRQADGTFADAEPTRGAANAAPAAPETPAGPAGKLPLVLNEINSSPADWVELMNTGTEAIDLSGLELRDNADDHRWQFPAGATIQPGQLLVVDAKSTGLVYNDQTQTYAEGTFESAIGIGSGDSIRLFDKDGALLDSHSWTEHASYEGDPAKASLGRYPDGTGAFCLTKETMGEPNQHIVPSVVINEVESNGDVTDWVEIINTGTQPVDISGWYVLDNDPVGHAQDTTPLPAGTQLAPGALYVFDGGKDFTFGLGGNDTAVLYTAGGVLVDSCAWTAHAQGVLARIPDGTGDFQDFAPATKGELNKLINPVVINEVQSSDPAGGPDWVELANPTGAALDISGLVLLDGKDNDPYTIPAGTTIPANGFLVIYGDETGANGFAFGLGKGDSVRLFENGELIRSTTWPEGTHTAPTWGLYPDPAGKTYQNTLQATPGAANKFAGVPDVVAWPGADTVTAFDAAPTFLEDSSGLDFADGKLYAVDNGTGTFWVMDVAQNGAVTLAPGFAQGKRVAFRKDAGNAAAHGPDAEGLTVDGSGMVYLAAERDNNDKNTNYNVILMADPNEAGALLTAKHQWDLTASLPQVSANMGIEAVEWVANAHVAGKLLDQTTGLPFDAASYPDAVAGGVFFVALEDNGHVYAYVLNSDETVVQIADIDTKLGGAMALDYDTYENALWAAADNGFGNRMAKITLNGTGVPNVLHVLPAAGVDTAANNEGFAIAAASYTVNGQRPVCRFCDGVASGALTIGSMACSYTAPVDPGTSEPGTSDPGTSDPGTSDPGTSDPGTSDPGTSDPGSSTVPGDAGDTGNSDSTGNSGAQPDAGSSASPAPAAPAAGAIPQTGDAFHWQAAAALAVVAAMGLAIVRKR